MLSKLLEPVKALKNRWTTEKSVQDAGSGGPDDQDGETIKFVQPYTMTSPARIRALCSATRYVVDADIPGAIVECGVWRGGMCAALAGLLGPERAYYLLDSFEGLPLADAAKDGDRALAWQGDVASPSYHDNCRAEMAWADQAMARTGAPRYTLVKGWFADTLPRFDPGPIALLRLDADWYESTLECLTALYPRVARDGLILIDDYDTWDGCTRAVHDYLSRHSLAERIRQMPSGTTYIAKSGDAGPV